jgi:hypothetical protein
MLAKTILSYLSLLHPYLANNMLNGDYECPTWPLRMFLHVSIVLEMADSKA